MSKVPITAAGLKRIKDELEKLKNEDRIAVIQAIKEARSHGDLSENAEYSAARESQSFIEGKIAGLEQHIQDSEVFDCSKFSSEDPIKFGAKVKLLDDKEVEYNYQLVSDYEADIDNFLLSYNAPLGRALIRKSVGDYVELNLPNGEKSYLIVSVDY